MNPKIILISGASCAGKTTLAKELKKSLNLKTYIFHQDNYSKDFSQLTEKQINRLNFDKPKIYNLKNLVEEVKSLINGHSFEHKTYNFISKKITREYIKKSQAQQIELIIIEGIYIFTKKDLLKLADLSIFIDVDDDILLSRRLIRDTTERGYDFKSSLKRYNRDVKSSYKKYIKPSKDYANLIINGNQSLEDVFKNIKSILSFNKELF
jgi:uridine kinase